MVRAARVSPDLFAVLGVKAEVGRTLKRNDETADDPVVVLGHAFWQSRFGGREDVLGRRLELDGVGYRWWG